MESHGALEEDRVKKATAWSGKLLESLHTDIFPQLWKYRGWKNKTGSKKGKKRMWLRATQMYFSAFTLVFVLLQWGTWLIYNYSPNLMLSDVLLDFALTMLFPRFILLWALSRSPILCTSLPVSSLLLSLQIVVGRISRACIKGVHLHPDVKCPEASIKPCLYSVQIHFTFLLRTGYLHLSPKVLLAVLAILRSPKLAMHCIWTM